MYLVSCAAAAFVLLPQLWALVGHRSKYKWTLYHTHVLLLRRLCLLPQLEALVGHQSQVQMDIDIFTI
jgi:hypothetical protein